MFSQFSHFFIKNSKLTFVFVLIILLSGVGSYIFLPKQYNPSITLPAFQIQIPIHEMDSLQAYNIIGSAFENSINEISGVEDIYTTSSENGVGIMVKFFVGENQEDAKIKLYQKISEITPKYQDHIHFPIIKSINPDDLPQITYSIYYTGKNNNSAENLSYIKNISASIKEELKTIKNVSTFEIIGGGKNYIFIEFQSNKLTEYNLNLQTIYQKLHSHFSGKNIGNISQSNGEKIILEIPKSSQELQEIKKIILSGTTDFIRLSDVADIKYGENIPSYGTYFSNKTGENIPSVFIGIGKKIGSNSVFVTQEIEEKISQLQKSLPSDIKIVKIQDEGNEAYKATSLLIKDLLESIGIVVIILVIFLGRKNALNTATSIPLILSLVFLYAYIVGFDINRISLFALILVIGMLVDDSIVVVENIHRHLEERSHTHVSKLQAILSAVNEVGTGVILSTITKILSFVGMFAVTGMMGEYMGPIPKFAIIALIFSIFIAFIINPWISNITESEEIMPKQKNSKWEKYDIRKYYKKFLEKFINDDKKSEKRRKKLKITFWISLILVTILPIYFGIFKARMLPKSDKDQMYVWIDGQRSYDVEKMTKIQYDFQNFLLDVSNFPKDLQVIENISSSIGSPFIGDFANLFRGGSQRNETHQVSMRVNFIKKDSLPERKKSEEIVIELRPYIDRFFSQNYPDLQYRILEDPPGPPVRATFMMNIQSTGESKDLEWFTNKVLQEVQNIQDEQKIVDLYSTLPTLFEKVQIELNQESIIRAGLDPEFVKNEISLLQNQNLVTFRNNMNYNELHYITFGVEKDFIKNIENLKNYAFINSTGEKIYLKNIAKFTTQLVPGAIQTDKKEPTQSIYAEMGDNSVVYPIVSLMGKLKKDDFLGENLKVVKNNFYEIVYLDTNTNKEYKILWDGEWKITMDTFRDLGTAMILSLLVIYFLMVAQFKSFGVGGLIMLPFLLGFYGIFPGFSLLYLLDNQYFNATGMIGIISLGGIVVGNAILLIDYINIRKNDGLDIKNALIEAGMVRFLPILLTSISAIFGAIKIVGDPVWSGLAWSIVFGLSSSAILTLLILPIFYYDSQKDLWESQKNT